MNTIILKKLRAKIFTNFNISIAAIFAIAIYAISIHKSEKITGSDIPNFTFDISQIKEDNLPYNFRNHEDYYYMIVEPNFHSSFYSDKLFEILQSPIKLKYSSHCDTEVYIEHSEKLRCIDSDSYYRDTDYSEKCPELTLTFLENTNLRISDIKAKQSEFHPEEVIQCAGLALKSAFEISGWVYSFNKKENNIISWAHIITKEQIKNWKN